MEIRPVEESEFDQYKRIISLAFGLTRERDESWPREEMDFSTTRALFVNKQMKAVMQILPFELWLGGAKVPMGGIGGVACAPESRRRGYVKKLIEHAPRDMRKKGFLLSCLYPFSYEFYRMFGWEHACDQKLYSFDPASLPLSPEPKSEMQPFSEKELPLVSRVYENFARTKSCSLVRDKKHWLQKVLKAGEYQLCSYLWKDSRGKVQGYIVYEIKSGDSGQEMRLRELVALSHEARCAIFRFLKSHDTQTRKVEFSAPADDLSPAYFPNLRVETKLVPDFAARVVDLKDALERKNYPADLKGTALFKITDPAAPWNSGTWSLSVNAGAGQVKKTRKNHDFACDIQTFTRIYCGYIDLLQAAELGKLEVTNPRKLPKIIPYFAAPTPYMNDYF